MAGVVPFTLAPALVTADVIDYHTREAQQLYTAGIAPLDADNKFDLDTENLCSFLQDLRTCSACMGWTHVLEVPPDLANPNVLKDLITQHGEVTLAQVRAYAQANIVGQLSRAAHDSSQLYHCLIASLTPTARSTITLKTHNYTFGDEVDGSFKKVTLIPMPPS